MVFRTHKILGRMLLEKEHITPDDLEQALSSQAKDPARLGEILLKMAALEEEDLIRTLAEQLAIPYMPLNKVDIEHSLIKRVPARLVNLHQCVPISEEDGVMKVATADPLNVHGLDELRLHLRTEIDPVFATSKDVRETIKKFYGIGADTMEGLVEDDADEEARDLAGVISDNIEDLAEDASIVRFVNQVINEAIDDRATDIHLEPLEDHLRIRYRIDGLLYEANVPQSITRYQAAIISRLKIMADLNIAERRLPQDGKIKVRKGESDFDLRVSTVPTPDGESVVLRILSRDSEFVTLEKLGFDPHHAEIMRRMINQPHGVIFVSGPTGSGKSTTLYAALNEINTTDKKILTIEEPIEYRIRGVMQVQVNQGINLTFARILRTFLRQDPDVIMVGETRDQETAEITIRTALTGHLVFTTIHTNDACSVVTRLLDMGIEPFLASSSVEGLLAQRLVRRLCPECKQAHTPDARQLARVNVTNEDVSGIPIYRPRGCEKCRYTGYTGRTAVYELVEVTEDFRRMIVQRTPANELKRLAIKNGMRPLRHDGWAKIKAGQTTIDEVLRVTMEDEMGLAEFEDKDAQKVQIPVAGVGNLPAPGTSAAAAKSSLPIVD